MTTRHIFPLAALLLWTGCGPTTADLEARDQRIAELTDERERELAELERLRARSEQLSRVVDGLTTDVNVLEGDREALRTSLEGAEGALGELSGARETMSRELARAEQDRGALQAGLADARRALEEIQARERQARARLATMRAMLAQLSAMIDAGQLRVRIVRNRMVVELPEAVLFDTGRAEIKETGAAVLVSLAPVLTGISDREFQVAGHTDSRPIRTRRYPSNWELSAARAVNVAKFLIENGVETTRVSAAGHADTQPVAGNDTEEGMRQNRRIEIILLPNLDELPDLSSLEGMMTEE